MDILRSGEKTAYLMGKWGLIIFLVIYVVFAVVVIRQVKSMTSTLSFGFEAQIKILVYLHFLISLLVLITAFLVL
jgi:hypothetical protein